MDVDSTGVIPGTPSVEDYASVGDSDESSRRTTPGYFEYEQIVAVKNGPGSSNGVGGQQQGDHGGSNGASTGLIAPGITYEVDLDNSEDDEQLEVQQVAVTARRTDRASSTSSSVNVKPAARGGKRKHHATIAAESRRQSPASTPGPLVDSTTVAAAPLLVPSTIPGFFTTRNAPMNKQGYRYAACGPSPNYRPALQLFRTIPSPPADVVRFSWEDRSSYVSISADAMAIATDKGWRSARANVPIREGAYYFEVTIERGSEDPQGLTKGDGFGPHVRVGLARREAPLNAPVGYDAYSYGIRDKTGDKVHISKPRAYGEALINDDVIGVYVYLPPRPTPTITADQPEYGVDTANPARIVRKRIPIRVKGQLYFEQTEYAPSKEMEDLALMTKDPAGFEKARQAAEAALKQKSAPPPGRRRAPPPPLPPPPRPLPLLRDSKVAFFKNGECQGLAFEDLFDFLPLRQQAKKPTARMSIANQIAMARENYHDDGTLGYYPMVSVFGGGTARLNPGPNFRYPPPSDIESAIDSSSRTSADQSAHIPWKPLSERYREYLDEQWRLDAIDEAVAIAAFEQKAAQAAANAAQQQQQQQQLQQQRQYPSPAPFNAPVGNSSASTSPKPIYNDHYGATVKRKTGLSNELVPIRDRSSSPKAEEHPTPLDNGMSPYVKQEEEETDADADGEADVDGEADADGEAEEDGEASQDFKYTMQTENELQLESEGTQSIQ
ncbi:hypothetical protein P389DRAFT_163379 [Cystobasidium minutum MCA 4210]|uniref:uncharacterized protein n=1 Tax=Cystobasidium minutum MCA 4210 TaxID=1397322 RepID=UPI0034CDAFD3|eukprot:jgi/Rhomi1/163379/estExt_Genewise1Plus.C_7_t10447